MSGSREPGALYGRDGLSLLEPEGHGAQYRELARNLRSLDGPPGSVVVTGVGEGVGCSTVCLGLGGALASAGLRVAVIDCNFERPRLHKMLGEPNFTGLTTALEGEYESYKSHESEDRGYEPMPGLLVIPTGPMPESRDPGLEAGDLDGILGRLREKRDVVLLDAPEYRAMLRTPALSGGYDGVLLVVHASRTDRSEAREAVDALADAGVGPPGVVFNGRE